MKRSVFQGVKTTDLGKKNKLSLNNLLLCVKTNNNVCFLRKVVHLETLYWKSLSQLKKKAVGQERMRFKVSSAVNRSNLNQFANILFNFYEIADRSLYRTAVTMMKGRMFWINVIMAIILKSINTECNPYSMCHS